jgi:hypothetical protein
MDDNGINVHQDTLFDFCLDLSAEEMKKLVSPDIIFMRKIKQSIEEKIKKDLLASYIKGIK